MPIKLRKNSRIRIRKPWMYSKNGIEIIESCPSRIVEESPYIGTGLQENWQEIGLVSVHKLTWKEVSDTCFTKLSSKVY
jgi:hypothetical protein